MFSALRHKRGSGDEEGYRKFYLETDVTRAKLAMLFFVIPMAGFAFNDYQFFAWSTEFFALAVLRVVLISIIFLSVFFISKAKNYHTYDLLICLGLFVLAIGSGIINIMRPQDFVVQAVITIISVFVVFLIVPFRFLYQCILAFAASIGEALIILLILKPALSPVLFTILFGLLLSNFIAAVGAYQLHTYRRNIYKEFVGRKEIQEKLEEHTKHLEELVEERTKKLRDTERLAAIGATAGMVGHDLRNPLTGITNASYYLKKKYSPQLDQTGQEMIQIIENNVVYSNKIINDLLDYSGNINLDVLSKATPKSLVAASLAMINLPSNIQVLDLTQDTPDLSVDVFKIKRVFVNIIKNAVDAMPDGGELTIKSEVEEATLGISFIDTGPGITVEEQKKLFQPLHTTKAKGMGFGLAICQRIVEAHGGKIKVMSLFGRGATFKVELPLKNQLIK